MATIEKKNQQYVKGLAKFTSQGKSKHTHFISKNDKRLKKIYRGQG